MHGQPLVAAYSISFARDLLACHLVLDKRTTIDTLLRALHFGNKNKTEAKMAYTDSSFSSAPSASSNEHDERKIFVGGLSWGTTDQDLREYFTRFGTVLDCVLKVDPATGRSRGFGFVLFSDVATVDDVLAQSHTLQGRAITPRKVRKGLTRGREPILKVFVGGLDPAVPEQEIWEHFGSYGKVTDLDLPYDSGKGCRRAFCFVSFDSEDGVDAACKDEKQEIGGKWVDVKRAIPRTYRNGWFNNTRGGGGPTGGGGGSYGGGGSGYNSRGSGGGGGGAYSRSGGGYKGYSTGYGGQRNYSSGYDGGYGGGNGYETGSYGSRGTSGGRSGRVHSQNQGWGRQGSGNYGSGYGYYNNNYDGYD